VQQKASKTAAYSPDNRFLYLSMLPNGV